ncbi:MAG: hypothetical protein ACR2N6_04575, partial [Miltoncostaeaceae bacterium]
MTARRTVTALALIGAGAALVAGAGHAAAPAEDGQAEQATTPAPRAIASRPTTRDAWTARV